MPKKLPSFFARTFDYDKLATLSDMELEKLRNGLWNIIETYEEKISRSRQPVVRLAEELELAAARDIMVQRINPEIERRKATRPKPN
jgi:hypothetical protein